MPRKLRKSFVGHPSANLFLRISRGRVFQQTQAMSQSCAFRSPFSEILSINAIYSAMMGESMITKPVIKPLFMRSQCERPNC